MSATLDGPLWPYNIQRILFVDVSDDYRIGDGPKSTDAYPIIGEAWLPAVALPHRFSEGRLMDHYLYDWHRRPVEPDEPWYVGVVHRSALAASE